MKRAALFTLSLAALALTILPAVASAQAKPKNQLLPNATVKSVSAGTVVVHLLRQGDQDLAHLFGAHTGDEVDKFENIDWRPGPDDCPVLARCDWFAGSIIERVDTGDHVAFVLAPHDGQCERSGTRQLGMHDIGDIEAGHPIPES